MFGDGERSARGGDGGEENGKRRVDSSSTRHNQRCTSSYLNPLQRLGRAIPAALFPLLTQLFAAINSRSHHLNTQIAGLRWVELLSQVALIPCYEDVSVLKSLVSSCSALTPPQCTWERKVIPPDGRRIMCSVVH